MAVHGIPFLFDTSNSIPAHLVLSVAEREEIESCIERLIAVLDAADGDCDNEDDDPTGQNDEDGMNTGNGVFYLHGSVYPGAGCPIADPAFGDDDIAVLGMVA